MIISKHNLRILIITNVLRLFLSYYIIFKVNFKTDFNNILKCYLLFFPTGIDDIDSVYPVLLKLFKIDKNITLKKPPIKFLKKIYNYFNFFTISQNFKDYYIIPDKINDLISNWSFFIYLKKENILDNFETNLLFLLLLNRNFGLFLYFFKQTRLLKKLNIDKKLFFYFPDYSIFFYFYFLIIKKYNKKRKNSHLLLITLLKLSNEYYLHVNK